MTNKLQNPNSKSNPRTVLEKYNIEPNKVLGQNFLIEPSAIEALVGAANLSKEDVVVEIGPGTGVITKELAKSAKQVVAVEKDENMVKILKEELAGFDNVEIIHEDILEFDIGYCLPAGEAGILDTGNSGYKVVGAIPYYLSGKFFRHFLEEIEQKPSLIAVIIQKEVAQKIVAKPSTCAENTADRPNANLLSNSVQLYGDVRIAQKVPRSSFWPQPDVDSALLVVDKIKKPDVDETAFFKVLRAGFSAPRKQLVVNISRELNIPRQKTAKALEKAEIDPKTRPQTLSVGDWKKLTKNLN